MDALRHALHPLHQLRGGCGRWDVKVLAKGVDRDAKAVVVFGLLSEVGFRFLQLLGQSLVPLRES